MWAVGGTVNSSLEQEAAGRFGQDCGMKLPLYRRLLGSGAGTGRRAGLAPWEGRWRLGLERTELMVLLVEGQNSAV